MSYLKTSRLSCLLPFLLLLVWSQAIAQEADGGAAAATAGPRATGATVRGATAPPDAAWSLTLDVKRFTESRVGQQILRWIEAEVGRELKGELGGKDLQALRAKIAESLGFDPLKGIGKVVVYGAALPFGDDGSGPLDEDEIVQRLATTAVAVLNLTGTTGNLEGLALATPKYQSEDYHGATIHSGVLPDIELTVYMGVYKPYQDHGNSVVFGLHQDLVKQALDRLMGRAGAEGPSTPEKQAGDAVPGEYFAASVKIDEQTVRQAGIPEQQSAVVKMIQRVSIAAGEDGDSLVIQLAADIVNQQRAEQIQQLLQGLMALLELPIEDLEKDEGFLLLRELVKGIEVTRTGNRVKCQLRKPADTFLKGTAAMLEEAF